MATSYAQTHQASPVSSRDFSSVDLSRQNLLDSKTPGENYPEFNDTTLSLFFSRYYNVEPALGLGARRIASRTRTLRIVPAHSPGD